MADGAQHPIAPESGRSWLPLWAGSARPPGLVDAARWCLDAVQDPSCLQPGEELRLAIRACGRCVDRAPEHGAGGLLPAAAPGVLVLRPGRPAGCRPVTGRGDAQAARSVVASRPMRCSLR